MTEARKYLRDVRPVLVLLLFACVAQPFVIAPVYAASCTCQFTKEQRATADKELWLNQKDKDLSLATHLPWGAPKSASKASGEVILIQRDYVIGYDKDLLAPLWTGHRLTKATLEAREKAKKKSGSADRKNCFRPDPRLKNEETAFCVNYDEPVYDQGHFVPDADMPHQPIASLVNSYIYSNIAPQHCYFNRGIWLILEGLARAWAKEKGEIYVLSGSVFDKDKDGKRDADSDATRISKQNKFKRAVAIPTHFYKIFLHRTEGSNLEAIAVLIPHTDEKITAKESKVRLEKHLTTVDAIEKLTGLDLPPNVSKAKSSPQEAVEKFLASALWDVEGKWPSTFDAACAK